MSESDDVVRLLYARDVVVQFLEKITTHGNRGAKEPNLQSILVTARMALLLWMRSYVGISDLGILNRVFELFIF